jgi:hypothetical protein
MIEVFEKDSENAFSSWKWLNWKTNGTIRKCSSSAFQYREAGRVRCRPVGDNWKEYDFWCDTNPRASGNGSGPLTIILLIYLLGGGRGCNAHDHGTHVTSYLCILRFPDLIPGTLPYKCMNSHQLYYYRKWSRVDRRSIPCIRWCLEMKEVRIGKHAKGGRKLDFWKILKSSLKWGNKS